MDIRLQPGPLQIASRPFAKNRLLLGSKIFKDQDRLVCQPCLSGEMLVLMMTGPGRLDSNIFSLEISCRSCFISFGCLQDLLVLRIHMIHTP